MAPKSWSFPKPSLATFPVPNLITQVVDLWNSCHRGHRSFFAIHVLLYNLNVTLSLSITQTPNILSPFHRDFKKNHPSLGKLCRQQNLITAITSSSVLSSPLFSFSKPQTIIQRCTEPNIIVYPLNLFALISFFVPSFYYFAPSPTPSSISYVISDDGVLEPASFLETNYRKQKLKIEGGH